MRSVLFETHCDSNMINSKKSTTRERQIHFPVHSPIHWTVIGKWTIDLAVWIGHCYLFPNTYISTRFKPQYKHLTWSKQYFSYNTVFIKHNPTTQRSRLTLDNQLNIKLDTTRFCCLSQRKKYDNDFALRDNNITSRPSKNSFCTDVYVCSDVACCARQLNWILALSIGPLNGVLCAPHYSPTRKTSWQALSLTADCEIKTSDYQFAAGLTGRTLL